MTSQVAGVTVWASAWSRRFSANSMQYSFCVHILSFQAKVIREQILFVCAIVHVAGPLKF